MECDIPGPKIDGHFQGGLRRSVSPGSWRGTDVFIRRPAAAALSQEVELPTSSVGDTPPIARHLQECSCSCIPLPSLPSSFFTDMTGWVGWEGAAEESGILIGYQVS